MKFTSQYPDTIYRVGVKAVIKDAAGNVFCVHDTGEADMWSLPGGGLDHGDSARVALARELKEEINYSGDFTMDYMGECIYPSRAISAYVLYMIFEVTIDRQYVPHAGVDAREVAYLQLSELLKYEDTQADIIKKFGFGQEIAIPISN